MSTRSSAISFSCEQEKGEAPLPFHRAASCALSLALFLGFGGSITAMLAIPVNGWLLLLAAVGVFAAVELLSERPKELFLGFAAASVLSLLAWAIAHRYARAGLALLSNAVTRLISLRNLQILAQYEVTLPQESHAAAVTLFLLPLALLLALLCILAVRSNLAIVPAGMLLFLFGVMLGFDCFAGAGWMLLLFLTFCLMLCRVNSPRRKTGAFLIPLAGLCAAFALAFAISPQGASDTLEGQRNALLHFAHRIGSESAALPMPEGRLTDASAFHPSDEIALTVTADKPAAMYLRGFVGGKIAPGGWTSLDAETLYQNQALFYRLHQSSFYPQKQLSILASAAGYRSADDAGSFTVEINNACRAYAYAPYETAFAAEAFLPQDGLDDASLTGGISGRYTLAVLPGLAAEYPSLSQLLLSQSAYPSEELSAYLTAEERYRRFAYEAYTQLDEPLKKVLSDHLSQGAVAGESHLSYADAKDAIRTLLAQTMTYSADDATPFDGSSESLKRLLDGTGRGFSAQYATIAALTFRYYGIPARYVEGYLLTGSDAKAMQSGVSYGISMKNAHAWVEYYHDGVGWIPFEVTPGYLAEVELPEDTTESDQPVDPITPPPEDPPKEDEPPAPEEQVRLSPAVWGVILLILLIAAWFLARYLVLQKRKEEFLQSNTNRAAERILRHLLRLLAAQKLIPPDASLFSLSQVILKEKSEPLALSYHRAVELANQAAFSKEKLSPAERDEMIGVLDAFVDDAEKTLPTAKKLLFRYGLWLY